MLNVINNILNIQINVPSPPSDSAALFHLPSLCTKYYCTLNIVNIYGIFEINWIRTRCTSLSFLDWVDVANDLLRKCGVNFRLTKLADCVGNVFLAFYENILGVKVPGRFKLFHLL
jgi:hypothetical protein